MLILAVSQVTQCDESSCFWVSKQLDAFGLAEKMVRRRLRYPHELGTCGQRWYFLVRDIMHWLRVLTALTV